MEETAIAEIARVQIRQWLRHLVMDRETVLGALDDELAALGAEYHWAALDEVRALFERSTLVPGRACLCQPGPGRPHATPR